MVTVDGTISVSHREPSYCSSLPFDDDGATGERLPGPLLPMQLPMVPGLVPRVRGRGHRVGGVAAGLNSLVMAAAIVTLVTGVSCCGCSSFPGVMVSKLAVRLLRAPWGPLSEGVGIWRCLFHHGSCIYRMLPFDHASALNVVCYWWGGVRRHLVILNRFLYLCQTSFPFCLNFLLKMFSHLWNGLCGLRYRCNLCTCG